VDADHENQKGRSGLFWTQARKPVADETIWTLANAVPAQGAGQARSALFQILFFQRAVAANPGAQTALGTQPGDMDNMIQPARLLIRPMGQITVQWII
jgi:hypothetical protein